MKKILITGGVGFIGSHLVETFLKSGYWVRVLDNRQLSKGKDPFHCPDNAKDRLEIITGDICDRECCRTACRNIDVVFHNAAISIIRESFERPEETYQVNVQGTRHLLESCVENNVERFIYSSSGKIFGDTDRFPSPEDGKINLTSPYVKSKYEAENLCRQFAKENDLRIIVLRYLSVYGPGQRLHDTLIGEILINAFKDNHSFIHSAPTMERDFTYIDDVIQANLSSINYNGSKFDVFNIGSGRCTSVEKLFTVISRILGKDIEPVYGEIKEGTVMRTEVDISKAHRLLNYEPSVPLPEGIARTVQWIKSLKENV